MVRTNSLVNGVYKDYARVSAATVLAMNGLNRCPQVPYTTIIYTKQAILAVATILYRMPTEVLHDEFQHRTTAPYLTTHWQYHIQKTPEAETDTRPKKTATTSSETKSHRIRKRVATIRLADDGPKVRLRVVGE